jgi:hypothetical protein
MAPSPPYLSPKILVLKQLGPDQVWVGFVKYSI